jgi:hypothetical protein
MRVPDRDSHRRKLLATGCAIPFLSRRVAVKSKTDIPIFEIVVWFFERKGSFVRFETRDVAGQPDSVELVIVQPDGTETVERFLSSDQLYARQLELQSTLAHDGWAGPYGRFF